MKKVISLLLAFSLIIISSIPVFSADKTDSITVWVASDIHFYSKERVGNMKDNELYDDSDAFYNATIQGQMSDISESIIRQFLDEFIASDCDTLLLPGDITQGFRDDHIRLSDIFRNTIATAEEQGKSKRIYVIDGNHDIDDDNTEKLTSAEEFKSIYSEFGYDNALAVDSNSCSYTADLGGGFRLLAIDSCVYGEDDGNVSGSKMDWVIAQTEKAKIDGVQLVTMMHHSVVPHFSVQPMDDDYETVLNTLADNGINTVLTGHIHANDVSSAKSENGNVIYDIMTGSLITSPDAYRVITYSADSVDVTTHYISKVKPEYLPEGMSTVMKQLIVDDFTAYAEKFFSEGMTRWLYKYIGSPHKIAKMLKVSSDSSVYKALDYFMSCFGDALRLPLYNDETTPGKYDSIEELAALYGYTLPKSEYKLPGDVVGKVMNSWYAGDENIKYTDVEIQLLLAVVSTGLVYSFKEMATGSEYNAATEILLNGLNYRNKALMLTNTGKIIAGKKLANLIVGSALVPLLEGISTDEYTPSDLNVTISLEVSVDSENTAPVSTIEKLRLFIRKFISVFKEMLSALKPKGC